MKSILIGLLLATSTALCQHSTTDPAEQVYCLSISDARLLVADALKLRSADSLLQLAESRSTLLESEKMSAYKSFTNLLKIEAEKLSSQKEITSDFERMATSYKDERDYYIKRERKQRRGSRVRDVIIVGLTGILVWTLIK